MFYKKPLLYVIFLLFIILLFTNLLVNTEQHFVLLAKSFLSGSLSFTQEFSNVSDLVIFDGKYYWALGPLPAILLMPFVFIFKNFLQGYLVFPVTLLNFYLIFRIAKKLNLDEKKSYLASIFFIFGSIYAPLALLPASWYFAQVIACTFLIIALFEFLTSRRYLLIGISVALATATRLNLIFSSLFFLYYIFKKPSFKKLAEFSIPIICALFFIGTYNFLRFGNPLESGYSLQTIPKETSERRNLGLFSIKHVPSNLYYMLVNGPEPTLEEKTHELKPPFITFDSYGLSIFFLSPLLFLIYKANFKKEIVRISTLTTAIIILPLITYYGIGQKQVGYRYALDFFPFVLLILLNAFERIETKFMYPLIFFGVFFCFFFSFLYLFGLEH